MEKLVPNRESLDKFLEKSKVPDFLRQEVTLIMAFLPFSVMLGLTITSPQIANCYYRSGCENTVEHCNQSRDEKPKDKSDESKGDSSLRQLTAASDFQRAIAFNPDHTQAHFELGWLYELRQDLDKAKDEYKAAMQTGSLLARTRLASIYLRENKAESTNAAVSILFGGLGEKKDLEAKLTGQQSTSRKEKIIAIESIKSWHTNLAWARVQQGRSLEAEKEAEKAIELIEPVVNASLPGDPPVGHVAYCVRAELRDKQAASLNEQVKRLGKQNKLTDKQKKINEAKRKEAKKKIDESTEYWGYCCDETNPTDPDEDDWHGKACRRVRESEQEN